MYVYNEVTPTTNHRIDQKPFIYCNEISTETVHVQKVKFYPDYSWSNYEMKILLQLLLE